MNTMRMKTCKVLHKLLMLCIVWLLAAPAGVQAQSANEELGSNVHAMPYRYRVKQGKSVKVRNYPDVEKGERMRSVEYPNIIYVDDSTLYEGSGYKWISISGNKGYIVESFLDKISNPYYKDTNKVEQTQIDTEEAHAITRWVMLVLAVITFFILLLGFDSAGKLWNNIAGVPNSNKMKRLFMFNPQPYNLVLLIGAYILLSILVAVVLLLILGGGVFVLLWIIKILLIILVWIGIIGCVIGVVCVLCGVAVGAIFAIIGGIIWYFSDGITAFGESCVEAGLAFFSELNMIQFTIDLFTVYWMDALLVAAFPILLFLAFATLALLFSGIVMFIEWCITKYYNIKHPCPFCHQPSEPAIYLSKGNKLPIKLRPGTFGLFKIKHPDTNEQMPTMLFNGRDKLPRECPHCHKVIRAKTGEEKHIAMVGLPAAGKSTLIYRMIGEMMRKYPSIEFADDVKPDIKTSILAVKQNGKLESEVLKTATTDLQRSIQLLVHRSGISLPYHLYINDVGGELFTKSNHNKDKLPFFNNIQSVLFLIDPFTAYLGKYDLSTEFTAWYTKNIGDVKAHEGKEELEDAFYCLKNILENSRNKLKNVHFNFVFVKKDTGYLKGVDINSESELKAFLEDGLGMAGEVQNVENNYASIHYHAVSAIDSLGNSNVDNLYKRIMEEINLKLE